jgi:hypothetical protein
MPVRVGAPRPEVVAAVDEKRRPLTAAITTVSQYTDRLRRAIQDGQTSDGETLAVARLEDLSDQVMAQATPTGLKFQVRFAGIPTQNFVSAFVVPDSLVAFVDASASPVTPAVDVDVNGVFTLAAPPAERLQVTYAWAYFQTPSLEAFLDEARAWVIGPATLPEINEVPDGLMPALLDNAAARALRALAAKIQLASAHSGDSGMDFSDLTKAYSLQAKEKMASAELARKSYYGRADQTLAPASGLGQLGLGPPYQPRR